MRLSAKIIINYCGNNMFGYANQWIIRADEPNTLYFQLVDLDQAGLRYMPSGTPVIMTVTFPSIDSAQSIVVTASLANAQDPSIFKVVLGSSQTPKSGNVIFELSEGGVIRHFSVLNAISVEYPGADGSC